MFRPMRKSDQAAVIALWRACGLVRPWNPPDQDMAEISAHTNAEILVAGPEGTPLASIVVGHDGHRGWVYYLAVAPEAQHSGWGRAAMEAAESWVSARGISKIQLMVRNSNTAVLDFYAALGYEEGGCTLMQKWLNPAREKLYKRGAGQ